MVYTDINHTIPNIRNYWRKWREIGFTDSDLDETITEASTKTESSTKTIEKMYDSDGDFIYVKPSSKTETKDIIKAKTKPDNNIYTRIKFECKKCHEEFRSKVALTTHSYSPNRMYLENTEDFDIN